LAFYQSLAMLDFMKLLLFLSVSILFETSARAEEHPCHALQYDSYFVAHNVKDHLKDTNADLKHANFAGHFLLLRAEFAFETLYLIASCETGEFFHEKLPADSAKFTLDSNQLDLDTKKGGHSHYEWDGNSWIQGQVTEAPLALSTPPGVSSSPTETKTSLIAQYDALFALYPEKTPQDFGTCASLDYSSYFRAQNNKDSILKQNPDQSKPNFAGTKLLLKMDTLFDHLYLLADCKTGKFSDDFLKGNLNFFPNSRLVLIKSSSEQPQLLVWSETQWLRIPDPVQKQNETIKNTLYGKKAALLAENIPNPHHNDVLRFEHLKPSSALANLFQDLGVDSLESGLCHVGHEKSPICTVETK